MTRFRILKWTCAIALALGGCAGEESGDAPPAGETAAAPADQTAVAAAEQPTAPVTDLPPNEMGLIPILEYHLIEEGTGQWRVTADELRQHMKMLYDRGYRPVTVKEMLDDEMNLPKGASPVIFTFDDASTTQFRYIQKPDGSLEIDPNSAVGIWLEFAKEHPGWGNKGVFCVLSNAEAGRAFFGNRDIEGQKTEWRFPKMKFLADQGFEICSHTLYHARLDKGTDAQVQEWLARLEMAVDSAVPGYDIRTMALPLGMWPRNRQLARKGSWTDPKSGKTITYGFDAILEVSGGPNVSPHDPRFDPFSLDRVIVYDNELQKTLDWLDRDNRRFVSDGDQKSVAKPSITTTTAGTAAQNPAGGTP